MVHSSAASLLAEYAEHDELEFDTASAVPTAERFASRIREQSSSSRFASRSRHQRKRSAKSQAPSGPRRRMYRG